MQNNQINIAFITDNKFVMQTYIALLSMFDNKNSTSNYNIVILSKELDPNNIKQLENLTKNKFSIKVLPLEENIIGDETCKKSVYSANVLYKLKLDKIFVDIDKILFLDSDIIIMSDLTELYRINIDNYYIAACKDIGAVVYNLKNKNRLYSNYFNTGVMLLNLNKIRNEYFFDKAISLYIENANNYYFPEQDVLNELIKDKIKLISLKYNFITSNARYTKKQLTNFFKEDIYNIKPVVLHYAGNGCRPWLYYNVYNQKEWNKYYKQSPYKKIKLNKKFIPFYKTLIFLINQYKIIRSKKIYKELEI